MIKRLLSLSIACSIACFAFGQTKGIDKIITLQNTTHIINTLADDSMQGRLTFTPGIEKAANFIAKEFKNIGLQPIKNGSYLQPFTMVSTKPVSLSAIVDGSLVDDKNIFVFSSSSEINIDQTSGFEIDRINTNEEFFAKAFSNINAKNNRLVLVNDSLKKRFQRLGFFRENMFKSDKVTIFLSTNSTPKTYNIKIAQSISEKHLANVVGILPGKSKKNEYVIFSGHYDHLGIQHNANGNDSIYNGANDDAAGTTAVIQLARYYKAMHNNERTIVFAAFTAEEMGGFGSQYFSRQFDPAKVVAMFNIEMIGTESKWGTNSAYITGYEKTNMGEILQRNLKGSGFTFYPDPYTDQQLFYRSDNATLARLGVPAHTISTSKMDSEPNYHKVSDEVKTLDLENMNRIIKSIALSATSIVAGKDTPSRVDTKELK